MPLLKFFLSNTLARYRMRLRQYSNAVFWCLSFLLIVMIAPFSAFPPANGLADPLHASALKSEVMTMTPDAIRSLIERAAASWMQGHAKAFAALFTPDGEFLVPGQRVVGTKAIEKVAAEFAESHTQVRISIQRVMIDRQQAVVEWQWEDTEKSTGKQSRADDAIVIDFADGHIKRWREYIDSQTPQVN